jgi:CheY-like chemotaxis protein
MLVFYCLPFPVKSFTYGFGMDQKPTMENAEKALHLAQDSNFNLIMLEIGLLRMIGFEIGRRLKEGPRLYQTPVVFVTGRPHEEEQRHAFEIVAVDCSTKPFDTLNLVRRILSHFKAGGISNETCPMNPTPGRNRQKARSSRSAMRTSTAPALAGWAGIPRPRCFERNARSTRPFPRAFPGSNAVSSAGKRYSSQTGLAADSFGVCAQALCHRRAKAAYGTRGFTSCHVFRSLWKMLNGTGLSLVFG